MAELDNIRRDVAQSGVDNPASYDEIERNPVVVEDLEEGWDLFRNSPLKGPDSKRGRLLGRGGKEGDDDKEQQWSPSAIKKLMMKELDAIRELLKEDPTADITFKLAYVMQLMSQFEDHTVGAQANVIKGMAKFSNQNAKLSSLLEEARLGGPEENDRLTKEFLDTVTEMEADVKDGIESGLFDEETGDQMLRSLDRLRSSANAGGGLWGLWASYMGEAGGTKDPGAGATGTPGALDFRLAITGITSWKGQSHLNEGQDFAMIRGNLRRFIDANPDLKPGDCVKHNKIVELAIKNREGKLSDDDLRKFINEYDEASDVWNSSYSFSPELNAAPLDAMMRGLSQTGQLFAGQSSAQNSIAESDAAVAKAALAMLNNFNHVIAQLNDHIINIPRS